MTATSNDRSAGESARLLTLSTRLGVRPRGVRVGELLAGLGRSARGLGLKVPALLVPATAVSSS